MATPKDANAPDTCPQCSALGRLRSVATVAHQREDYKLTYSCQQCRHEWAVVQPAHWMTRLGEDDSGVLD